MEICSVSNGMKCFTITIIVIVGIAVIAGFFVVGSPQEERLRRFDDQRVNDLQLLQMELVNYWQNKQVLPASLSLLKDDIKGFVPPKDPQTGFDYGYEAKGTESFSLCADFSRPSLEEMSKPAIAVPMGSYGPGENWQHGAGRICFDRTIDKELYKPIKR